MLWKRNETKGRGDEYYDPASEQKIVNRDAVRQELWTKHLPNPVLALTQALRWVQEWEEVDSSTAEGNRISPGTSAEPIWGTALVAALAQASAVCAELQFRVFICELSSVLGMSNVLACRFVVFSCTFAVRALPLSQTGQHWVTSRRLRLTPKTMRLPCRILFFAKRTALVVGNVCRKDKSSKRFMQKIVEVVRLVPQERILKRAVEEIVDFLVGVIKVIPQEQMSIRIVEQIVDLPVLQITEEIVEVARLVLSVQPRPDGDPCGDHGHSPGAPVGAHRSTACRRGSSACHAGDG